MADEEIDVQMQDTSDGWTADVHIRSSDDTATRHSVNVTRAAKERLAPNAGVAELVRASFQFLLEREPKESILRTFDIDVISRYFPEYEREIRGLARS